VAPSHPGRPRKFLLPRRLLRTPSPAPNHDLGHHRRWGDYCAFPHRPLSRDTHGLFSRRPLARPHRERSSSSPWSTAFIYTPLAALWRRSGAIVAGRFVSPDCSGRARSCAAARSRGSSPSVKRCGSRAGDDERRVGRAENHAASPAANRVLRARRDWCAGRRASSSCAESSSP
jgi:hypothetical protein